VFAGVVFSFPAHLAQRLDELWQECLVTPKCKAQFLVWRAMVQKEPGDPHVSAPQHFNLDVILLVAMFQTCLARDQVIRFCDVPGER
jgi:hypothetical protein